MEYELIGEGRHSKVFRDGKRAIKVEKLKGVAQKEARWLRILNKHGVGPKLLEVGKNYVVYEFVEGEYFEDILREGKLTWELLEKCLRKAFLMDKLGINKEEFHRPLKHIIVKKGEPRLIDFERCKEGKPKNLSQFISFLLKGKVNEEMKKALREYKREVNEKNFQKVLSLLKLHNITKG